MIDIADIPSFSVRAERKAGEMLGQLERAHGNRFVEKTNSEYSTVLKEQNIPNTNAHRWQ